MNLSREDLIILTASILYAACPAITEAPRAVAKALEIEGEVKRQRKEQERRDLPADFRDHLPSALHYAKEKLMAKQPDTTTGKTCAGTTPTGFVCAQPFHWRMKGYVGYHCVCSNFNGHNIGCHLHNEANRIAGEPYPAEAYPYPEK